MVGKVMVEIRSTLDSERIARDYKDIQGFACHCEESQGIARHCKSSGSIVLLGLSSIDLLHRLAKLEG